MFQTVPLSIIRSISLYTQQWYMSNRFADSCNQMQYFLKFIFGIKNLHVSDNSSVHHQEFFTANTAMVCVIQLASRIRMERPDPVYKLYDIHHCRVCSEKLLMMDSGTVRNM